MQNINEFLKNDEHTKMIFEESEIISTNESLENVYESIYDKMVINEGFFSKIGQFLKNLVDKAFESDEQIEKATKLMSKDAQEAMESVKQKSGSEWDNIKSIYTSIISKIDTVIKTSKKSLEIISSLMNVDLSSVIATNAKLMVNLVASKKTKLNDWIDDKPKMTAVNITLAGLIMAKKNGMKDKDIQNLITSVIEYKEDK